MSSPHQQPTNFIRIGSTCSICCDDLVDSNSDDGDGVSIPLPVRASNGDTINRLPCNHDFHGICIILWLLRSNRCPLCRYNLPKDFPMKTVFERLSPVLTVARNSKGTPAKVYFLFIFIFYFLDIDPSNSGPHIKPFFIRAMHELRSHTTLPNYETHDHICEICSGELYYYFSADGDNTCPLCRCNLPKDISIKFVLQHLIAVLELQNGDCLRLVYQLFECILYLLVRDEENSRRAKPFLLQTRQQLRKWLAWMI